LAAFQVIVTTSIPVYNKIIEAFGYVSKLALPVDQIAHYTKFQIWFFAFIVVFASIGQYFWWNKAKADRIEKNEAVLVKNGFSLKDFNLGVWEVFSTPLMIAFVATALIITLTNVTNWIYIVLLTACVFSLVCNGSIIWDLLRKQKAKISGGAITHIGVALMLIGIMYSSGYSKVISLNNSGLLISNAEAFTNNNNQENKENVMLWLNKPNKMGNYLLTYKGQRIEARELSGYLPKEDLEVLPNDFRAVAQKDIVQDGKTQYKQGDTLEVFTENTFYEIEYREPNGRVFTLYPKAQVNPKMGLLASPDIHKTATTDLYTHVSYVNDPTGEVEWSKPETHVVAMQDTFFVNDYVAVLEKVGLDNNKAIEGEAAVKAQIRILDKDRSVEMSPVYLLNTKTGMAKRSPVIDMAVGLKMRFESIDPKAGKFTFTTQSTQKEFVVLKALEKPLINLLWIGVIVLIIGFVLAIRKEQKLA
jgi:cytochrome c-type biogenesis protein CcmF